MSNEIYVFKLFYNYFIYVQKNFIAIGSFYRVLVI